MARLTAGDVYDELAPVIREHYRAAFREEAARRMVDPILVPETGEPASYPCFRCFRFHKIWSGIGKRHRDRANG